MYLFKLPLLKIILVILILSLFTGCSTVKIEMGGQPAPNYIKQINILGLDVKLEMAYAYFYQRPEGDEMLDTLQYIESNGLTFYIKKENLVSINCMCNVFNPNKKQYRLKIHHAVYGNSGKRVAYSTRTLYKGDLSSKRFKTDLSLIEGVTHEIWLALYDENGVVRYSEPMPLRYTLE